MKAAPAYAALGNVGLLSCAGKISRFGRQARLGERGDSGLTAYRRSEFATLDKMRQKHKTRLGRFITSPRHACRPPLALPSPQFPHFFWGQTPCCVGAPKSVIKTRCYSDIIHSYRLNVRK